MRKNKYNNVRVEVDDIKFDSKVEARYYEFLKREKRYNRIQDFEIHKTYDLLDSYSLEGERKNSTIKYIADFIVIDTNHIIQSGNIIQDNKLIKVIDIKGGDTTSIFKLKKKMFESKYKLKLYEARIVNGNWEYT